jgi:hypothetical protein
MQDPTQKLKRPDINSGLEEELFYEYRHDRKSVDAGWKQIFEGNGHDVPSWDRPTADAPRLQLPSKSRP